MKSCAFLFSAVLLAGITTAAFAEDVNGEWVVEQTGAKPDANKVSFEFEAHGTTLTGSMLGYPEFETPIFDGKIHGDKITFSVKEYRGKQTITYLYTGKISGDIIKFDQVALLGHGIPPHKKFTVKRVAP